jgi:creatinine amidohydrolase
MSNRRISHFVADLAWDEVERRLAEGADAILPIGAAAKEHGLHLPMNTDQLQAEYLAGVLASRFNALIWPTLAYGYYPAFRDYPGSISLSESLFRQLVSEVAAQIARWKPRRLFVLDTGISTLKPVAAAIADGAFEVPVIHLQIHAGPRYRTAVAQVRQQVFGSHADELETSRMIVMAPEVVQADRAIATPRGPIEGPLTRENAPSGSYGDPTLATQEKGKILLDAMMADLAETMEFPL